MDKKTREARAHLASLVWIGLGISVLGGIVMAATWPHTTMGFAGAEEHGSRVGLIIGAFLAWGGTMLLQVGLIGYGVMYGREASPTRLDPARDA